LSALNAKLNILGIERGSTNRNLPQCSAPFGVEEMGAGLSGSPFGLAPLTVRTALR